MEGARTVGVETPERLLNRLEWEVIRRLDGQLQELPHGVPRVGLDFLDLREYEPGDDVRHIDWNVTARMDTPFVRQYSEDPRADRLASAGPVASMGFGPIDRPKELVLSELATTFARMLTRRGKCGGRSSSTTRSRRRSHPATTCSPSPAACCSRKSERSRHRSHRALLEFALGAIRRRRSSSSSPTSSPRRDGNGLCSN